MYRAKKGTQWLIGMKAHIGLDADAAANGNDVTQIHALQHGEERRFILTPATPVSRSRRKIRASQ